MSSFISSFIAGSTILLSFIILTNPRRVNLWGNRWLAVFLFIVGILIFDKGLFDSQFYQDHIALLGYTDALLFFIGPVLYLSVANFVSLDKTFNKQGYLHLLLPFAILPLTNNIMLESQDVKIMRLNSLDYPYSGETFLLVIQITVYWFLSFFKLQKHQRTIQLFSASTAAIDLNWLKYFLLGIAGMIVIFILEFYCNNPFIFKYASFGYLIAVYAVGYFALRQHEVFPFAFTERIEIKEIIAENNPAQKQERLSDVQLTDLKHRLLHLMEQEEIYLEESLNLPKLANKMAISTHDLSYLLNVGLGENFFHFINAYRVEAAKRLLLSEQHDFLNMLGIAYAAGFSSKTTFYTTFKKFTQQSPSEFQRAAQKSRSAGSLTV